MWLSFLGFVLLVEFDVVGVFEFSVEVSDGFVIDIGIVFFMVFVYMEWIFDYGFDYLVLAVVVGVMVFVVGNEVWIVVFDGLIS